MSGKGDNPRTVDISEHDGYESLFDRLYKLMEQYKEETGIDLYFETETKEQE